MDYFWLLFYTALGISFARDFVGAASNKKPIALDTDKSVVHRVFICLIILMLMTSCSVSVFEVAKSLGWL